MCIISYTFLLRIFLNSFYFFNFFLFLWTGIPSPGILSQYFSLFFWTGILSSGILSQICFIFWTGILSPGALSPWDSVFQGFSFLLGFCLTGFSSDWDYISLGLYLTGIISHWDFVILFSGISSYWDIVLLGLCHRLLPLNSNQ